MRLLVIQHVSCEPPGFFEEELDDRGIAFDRVDLGAGDELPAWQDYDGIVVMGGPMGIGDTEEHPWLIAELSLITEAVADGRPYLGVCLGAQLLAAALGAEVFRGVTPEVGVQELQLLDAGKADPVLGGLPRRLDALHWHEDTFTIPAGAELLASTALYPHQAFRSGNAWGLQFHLEVDADLARQWFELPAYVRSAEAVLGVRALEIPERVAAIEPVNRLMARDLMARWLTHSDLTASTARRPLAPAS